MAWTHTLLDASYKGVPFEVVDDVLQGMHALAEHNYPYVDGSDIEDTGCEAVTMDVTAIVYGDDYEGRLQRLLKVLRETGAGELVHPVYGSIPDCVVADFSVRHSEERPDYADVSISFKQSVAGAPFFEREFALALADEIDWLADLAAWQGFEVFHQALAVIQQTQGRWNAFHAAVLGVVGVLHAQVGGVFSGSLDLLGSPRVLVTELQAVFGALAERARGTANVLDGWRSLADGSAAAVNVPWQMHYGVLPADSGVSQVHNHGADTADVAALTALVATVAATALASEAADILAVELGKPTLTPVEVGRVLADCRDALQRGLAAQRICGLMPVLPGRADDLGEQLIALYRYPDTAADAVYQQLDAKGLLPAQQHYLTRTAELADTVRHMAHTLQKQALAVINLRPPLVQKTVHADSSLHLLAALWYGDYRRFAELLRLNPDIVHPNFISRGTVINAYAK